MSRRSSPKAPTRHELAAAVTSEIGQLFGAARAYTMRWNGDTIRAIGDWCSDPAEPREVGRVYSFGGDTVIARVVETQRPRPARLAGRPAHRVRAGALGGVRLPVGARRPDRRRRRDLGRRRRVPDAPRRSVPAGPRAAARQLRGARGAGDLQRRGAARGGRARRRAVRAAGGRDAGGGRTPAGGGARRR